MKGLSFARFVFGSCVFFAAVGADAQNLLGSFVWSGNGHSYSVYAMDGGIAYDDAATYATSTGGYLATVTSADENDAITANLGGLIPYTAYLGAQQPVNETDPSANWEWVTGEAWSYTSWNTGEPNDFNGPASEQYLEIYGDGTWNDIGQNFSGYNNGFIVETVPEPASALVVLFLPLLMRRRKRS